MEGRGVLHDTNSALSWDSYSCTCTCTVETNKSHPLAITRLWHDKSIKLNHPPPRPPAPPTSSKKIPYMHSNTAIFENIDLGSHFQDIKGVWLFWGQEFLRVLRSDIFFVTHLWKTCTVSMKSFLNVSRMSLRGGDRRFPTATFIGK